MSDEELRQMAEGLMATFAREVDFLTVLETYEGLDDGDANRICELITEAHIHFTWDRA